MVTSGIHYPLAPHRSPDAQAPSPIAGCACVPLPSRWLSSEKSIQADLNFDARRQVELHQRVDRFFGGLDDVQKSFVSADLVLVPCVFIDVR